MQKLFGTPQGHTGHIIPRPKGLKLKIHRFAAMTLVVFQNSQNMVFLSRDSFSIPCQGSSQTLILISHTLWGFQQLVPGSAIPSGYV